MVVSIPWINFTSFLNEKLSLPERWGDLMEKIRENDETSWDLMRAYLQTENISSLLINIFMVALIPALGEEFFFRGTVQRILTEWFRNEHLAIWIAALLFSLMHYQFLGFIPRVMLGALFGYSGGNLLLYFLPGQPGDRTGSYRYRRKCCVDDPCKCCADHPVTRCNSATKEGISSIGDWGT
jgi:hypothetical protein